MSKQKKIIAIVIVAIVGTLIFWKRNLIKAKLGLAKGIVTGEESGGGNTLPPSTPGVTYRECSSWPLKLGCKGKNVVTLQKMLNKVHGAGLKEDGYFGPKTETALAANGYGETAESEDIAKLMKQLFST